MYNYNNYIHSCNANARVRGRYFNDVIRSKMEKDSSKAMFSDYLEVNQKAFSKYDSLSRIKNSFLKSYENATIISKTSTNNTEDTKDTGSASDSKKTNNSTTENKIEDNKSNTLKVVDGKEFEVDLNGKRVTFACQNGQVYMSKRKEALDSFDMAEVGRIEQIITSLSHDASGNFVKSNFTNTQIKNVLEKIGIKPGEFTINTSDGSNKFYMLDSGKIYSNYEVEATRNFYNDTDFKKCFGYSDNAVCKINNNEYKITSDGSFNIPSGVICVPENMIIKK